MALTLQRQFGDRHITVPSIDGGSELTRAHAIQYSRYWALIQAALEGIKETFGKMFRNALFLPLYQTSVDPDIVTEARIATHAVSVIKERHKVIESIEDKEVVVGSGVVDKYFKIRVLKKDLGARNSIS
jgi:hypothetical protein